MSDQLRNLVNLSSFQNMHNRLERWSDKYLLNTCDQNTTQCIELLEMNAKMQGQLFNLLSTIAIEGGTYGGCDPLKRRLLPWLSQGISRGASQDTSMKLLSESAQKDKMLREMTDQYEMKIGRLESELKDYKSSSGDLKNELEETRNELQLTKKSASGDLALTEDELLKLRNDLDNAQNEIRRLKSSSLLVDDYESQIRRLKSEVNVLRDEKSLLLTGIRPAPVPLDLDDDPLPVPASRHSFEPPSSPVAISSSPSQVVKQHSLMNRFNDLYTRSRNDAMSALGLCSSDIDRNQRIVTQAVIETFREVKLAFRQYRLRVRKALLPHQSVDESLEEAVTNYIDRHGEFHEVFGLKYHEVEEIVTDVLRALNRNPSITYAPHIDYFDLKPFIRKVTEVAWSMQCLHESLDVHLGMEDELIKDSLYRRSFDSDYSSYLVHHFVWPALLDAHGHVLTKGECVTRKAGDPPRRSRSSSRRSRSISPRRPIKTY
ncbi:mitochondria-eating protein-like isoform X2 [Convolutriloba macropyga]|uniref:mitochondria-eating protein-like isoform X2 n=1 Tax=Convolutriloba macropyga TaxID=536237 RepID=UPI003F528FB3